MTISAASFCGFFVKWGFRDGEKPFSFTAMIEKTAESPFIHRQLIPVIAQSAVQKIPPSVKENLYDYLSDLRPLERRYAKIAIPPKYFFEYHFMYALSFLMLFAAILILRSLLCEILQDEFIGTLGAFLFALLFPHFEVYGGYYYDIGEIFFMFLAAKFALHGKFIALLILAPIATLNKESFFFFLLTLYPLTRQNFNVKKSLALTLITVFESGVAYLFLRQMFANAPGAMADWRISDHMQSIFDLESYFLTDWIYGVPFPAAMFVLHIIYVIFIVKSSWQNLNDTWKLHAKIALAINGVLYFLFVLPGELRDLSMLYLSFIILTTYFIRDIFLKNYGKGKFQ